MNAVLLVVLLLACLISEAYGAEKQQPQSNVGAAASKAAGSENNPFFIKQHKSTQDKAEDDKQAADAQENLNIQRTSLKVSKDALIANQETVDYTKQAALAAIVAASAAVLACLVAIGQLVMFWVQLGHMKASNRTAATAADAALRQATGSMLAERAYLQISHKKPGVSLHPDHPIIKVDTNLKNHGNTPANLSDEVINHVITESGVALPTVPTYKRPDDQPVIRGILVKDEAYASTRQFPLSESDFEAIKTSDKNLFIIGYADYVDIFGIRHRTGYARKFDLSGTDSGNNLCIFNQEGYNYVRERNPDEGNDWTPEAITAYGERNKSPQKT